MFFKSLQDEGKDGWHIDVFGVSRLERDFFGETTVQAIACSPSHEEFHHYCV